MYNYKVIQWTGGAGLICKILFLLEIPLCIIRVILVLLAQHPNLKIRELA
jgi:hypothetical protein